MPRDQLFHWASYINQQKEPFGIWLKDIQASGYSVYVSSNPSGWNHNEIGMAWLELIYDSHTKGKSERYQLLILDGHGSHISLKFVEYFHLNWILLSKFPPYSTHMFQSLDVILSKPLSSAYSCELKPHQHQALGLNPIKKGDFFPLFWSTWIFSLKEETIKKSFEPCGIWPMDAWPVLKNFSKRTHILDDEQSSSSRLAPIDWINSGHRVRTAVNDTHDKMLWEQIYDVITGWNKLSHTGTWTLLCISIIMCTAVRSLMQDILKYSS